MLFEEATQIERKGGGGSLNTSEDDEIDSESVALSLSLSLFSPNYFIESAPKMAHLFCFSSFLSSCYF